MKRNSGLRTLIGNLIAIGLSMFSIILLAGMFGDLGLLGGIMISLTLFKYTNGL